MEQVNRCQHPDTADVTTLGRADREVMCVRCGERWTYSRPGVVAREREAWRIVLDGAEEVVAELPTEGDERWTDREWDEIRARARELVRLLRDALKYPGIRAQVWE